MSNITKIKYITKRKLDIRRSLLYIKNPQNRKLITLINQLKQQIFDESYRFVYQIQNEQKNQNQKSGLNNGQVKIQQDSSIRKTNNVNTKKDIVPKDQFLFIVRNQPQQIYPLLFTRLLYQLYEKALYLKNHEKKSRNLPLNEPFISRKTHSCPYCKKQFARPCSLGGHISKLHKNSKKQSEKPQRAHAQGQKNNSLSFNNQE